MLIGVERRLLNFQPQFVEAPALTKCTIRTRHCITVPIPVKDLLLVTVWIIGDLHVLRIRSTERHRVAVRSHVVAFYALWPIPHRTLAVSSRQLLRRVDETPNQPSEAIPRFLINNPAAVIQFELPLAFPFFAGVFPGIVQISVHSVVRDEPARTVDRLDSEQRAIPTPRDEAI